MKEMISTTFLPDFIYSYNRGDNGLHRTKLFTGDESFVKLGTYWMKNQSIWCEIPGGSLYLTATWHFNPAPIQKVISVETAKDFAIVLRPQMNYARNLHGATYFRGYLYAIGGLEDGTYLKECERLKVGGNHWETLASIPKPCARMSLVGLEDFNSLYVIGGYFAGVLQDTIQRFCAVSLRWEVLELKLPAMSFCTSCFKVEESKAYLVIKKDLFVFSPWLNSITYVKSLSEAVWSNKGQSYYKGGTLFCSSDSSGFYKLQIGSLYVDEVASRVSS